MVIIPIYNTVILPNVKLYFKNELLDQLDIKEVQTGESVIFVILKDGADQSSLPEEFKEGSYYPIGVSGKVLSIDEKGGINVETHSRVTIEDILPGPEIITSVRPEVEDLAENAARIRLESLRKLLLEYVNDYQWGLMARGFIMQWHSLNEVVVGLSPFLSISNQEKYDILAADSQEERADLIEKAVRGFMAASEVGNEAEQAQQEDTQKLYREDALKRQIRYLQDQLDQMHPENITDARRFEKKIEEAGMNEEARKEAENVLLRFKQEGQDGHEYGMLYDYLDFVTSLEWKKEPVGRINLNKAKKILDRDHYGLKKVKDRILEHLAVMALNKKQSGSILLFVGAPGTGKTSIGKSIADALGRKYVRISLGGVRDEAEIRGHRRTYIGAMPGRIMDGIKKSGVSNPVVVLDEVDKLSMSYNGDPSSALLEVLDPEQNNTFTDHYMNVPYDLSDVLFICTANTTDTIPSPLLDRMEMIRFPGYSPLEKFSIAKKHLLPKAKEKTGIAPGALRLTDDAIDDIINSYTMEAGVRGLKKKLETLCRHAAVELVSGKRKRVSIGVDDLPDYLDQVPIRHGKVKEVKEPGIVTGLAWTAVGGEILFIETMFTKGSGKIQITGQLGDVMKESAQLAISLVKKLYPDKVKLFEENDLHIHVPEGAVPKDGPSAGITLTTALSSLVNDIPVDPTIAMTGEVSLRGDVMPIGGLPEKLMAAQRAGVKKVFIPDENVDSLRDVAPEVLEALEIVPVKHVTEVLRQTLGGDGREAA